VSYPLRFHNSSKGHIFLKKSPFFQAIMDTKNNSRINTSFMKKKITFIFQKIKDIFWKIKVMFFGVSLVLIFNNLQNPKKAGKRTPIWMKKGEILTTRKGDSYPAKSAMPRQAASREKTGLTGWALKKNTERER
jgi:hypothetical protein